MKPKEYSEVSKYEQLNTSVRESLIAWVVEILQVIYTKQGRFIFYSGIGTLKSNIIQTHSKIEKRG